jgi:hypothetical protein
VGIAAVILLTGGIFMWRWKPEKRPVPWPAGVTIDEKTFRNVSFAKEIGPFAMVAEDGILSEERDGQPDGDRILPDDLLEPLKIGTSLDEIRYRANQSNWYMVRYYFDRRKDSPVPLWGVELYYYTGLLDAVPHVPEICGEAGGGNVSSGRTLDWSFPGQSEPWAEFPIRAVTVDRPGMTGGSTQFYYFFSVNGEPFANRNDVRLQLSNPLVKYSYYAKVQFYPLGRITPSEELDTAAREFLTKFLSEILSQLPEEEKIRSMARE